MPKDWTKEPDATRTFAGYCAPTALAGLMDCPKEEAAALLLSVPGMVKPTSEGWVWTSTWLAYLRDELGGWLVTARRPDGHDRMMRGMDPTTACYYTVSQFLRRNPKGTFVLSVRGHTLLARDGEVTADTRRSGSARSRVMWAVRFD